MRVIPQENEAFSGPALLASAKHKLGNDPKQNHGDGADPCQHRSHQQIPILQKPGSNSPNQDSNDGGDFVLSDSSLHVIPEAFKGSSWHCCC
jgi:hypothetical protein